MYKVKLIGDGECMECWCHKHQTGEIIEVSNRTIEYHKSHKCMEILSKKYIKSRIKGGEE